MRKAGGKDVCHRLRKRLRATRTDTDQLREKESIAAAQRWRFGNERGATRENRVWSEEGGNNEIGRGSDPPLPQFLALGATALVAVAMIVEIARRMTGVVVMLTRLFLLTGLVTMTVVVEIAGLVARVIVVFAGFFRCHVGSPMRVHCRQQHMVTLVPSAASIPRTRR